MAGGSKNEGMARLTLKILNLSDGDRHELQQLINRHNTLQQIALRAKIILMASDGQNHREIARSLDINRQMARLWRNRWFETEGKDLSIFAHITTYGACWRTSKI